MRSSRLSPHGQGPPLVMWTSRNTMGRSGRRPPGAGESWTCRCRCGSLEWPLFPTAASGWPRRTTVAHLDRDAALLEVGHRHVAAAADVDHEVVGVVAVGARAGCRRSRRSPRRSARRPAPAPATRSRRSRQRGVTASGVRSPVRPEPLEVDGVALVRGVTVEQNAAAAVQHEPLAGQW